MARTTDDTTKKAETESAAEGTRARSTDLIEAKYRRSRIWTVVLAVLVVFLGIVVVAEILPGQSPTSSSSAGPAASSAESSAADGESGGAQEMGFVRRDPDDPMAIGDVDAPVVLTEWIDLRCPFCAAFSRNTLPTLVEEYVDTGQVRIEFVDVAFFGEESEDAAVAARAAANQDKFVEFVTAVYDASPERGHPDLPRDVLIDFADQAGVPDIDRFTADLDDPEIRADAQASTQYSQQIGVTAVPFFFAGDMALSGAQPTATFQEFLDQALAQAK